MSEPQLTEAQRETLGRAMHAAGGCHCGGYFYRDGDALAPAVERILAEHTQTLRDEVERLTSERDRAREECGHEKAMRAHLRDDLYGSNSSKGWIGRFIEQRTRAEAAEAEVRRLRNGIEALVVEIESPYEAGPRRRREWVDRLRTLLDGGDH